MWRCKDEKNYKKAIVIVVDDPCTAEMPYLIAFKGRLPMYGWKLQKRDINPKIGITDDVYTKYDGRYVRWCSQLELTRKQGYEAKRM